jgi:hypothetical protein
MHHPERDRVGPALVPDHQLAEGAGIASPRVFDELSIVRLQALDQMDGGSATIIQRGEEKKPAENA